MTKRRGAKNPSLPNPGDVFLMPLEDGRFGVCRVIQKSFERGEERVLVVATPWIGSREPELSETLLREVLMLNHHVWGNVPAALWIFYPLPAGFTLLGHLEPTQTEKQMVCNSGAAWPLLAVQVLLQWRWDNDREALLHEEDQENREKSRRREASAQQRRDYLAGVTLEALRDKQRFASWEGFVSKGALQATRKVFHDTVDALIALGPEAAEPAVLDVLRGCIESLNALDSQYGGFIETIERENLCAEFDEIVSASGLGHYDALADRWREW
jgi:hypothetical protein